MLTWMNMYFPDTSRTCGLSFERDPSVPAIEQNIEAMRQIKEICDENGVTLKVVIGPTFLAEIYKFEGEAYYDYLRELVKITDIWDSADLSRKSESLQFCK